MNIWLPASLPELRLGWVAAAACGLWSMVWPAVAAAPAQAPKQAAITVNSPQRWIALPAVVCKQGTYLELKGALEYVLVSSGGKEYESLFKTAIPAADIQAAFREIGLRDGVPGANGQGPRGQKLRILVEYKAGGKTLKRPVDELMQIIKTGKPMAGGPWIFTGSATTKDPSSGETLLQASLTHSIVGLHHTDASPLIQNPRPEAAAENVYSATLKELPAAGTEVRMIFERIMPQIPPGTKRVRVEVKGRVTGVGFRNFTQFHANSLKLTGYVTNAAADRVEAVIEGPSDKINQLLEKMKRGPLAAKVAELRSTDVPPEGDFDRFEIHY